uniref:MFS transporter sugar efflux n=1 Tax=Opalinidae sp. TaxID=2059444 RepID=A0A649UZI2_9STRA|nr:MFS transporter sugar efflux [Opalinidae sp.]
MNYFNLSKLKYTLYVYESILCYGLIEVSRGVILPDIKQDFDLSYAIYGILLGSIGITYVTVTLIGSYFISKISIKKILQLGYLLVTIGAITASLYKNLISILSGIYIYYVGLGLIEISINPFISRYFVHNIGLMINIYHSVFGIGAILSPILAGYCVDNSFMSYRLFYFIIGLLYFVVFIHCSLLNIDQFYVNENELINNDNNNNNSEKDLLENNKKNSLLKKNSENEKDLLLSKSKSLELPLFSSYDELDNDGSFDIGALSDDTYDNNFTVNIFNDNDNNNDGDNINNGNTDLFNDEKIVNIDYNILNDDDINIDLEDNELDISLMNSPDSDNKKYNIHFINENNISLTYKQAITDPIIILLVISLGFQLNVEYSTSNWGSLYLEEVWNLDHITDGSIFISGFYIIFTVSLILFGYVYEKIGFYNTLLISISGTLLLLIIGFNIGPNGRYVLMFTSLFISSFFPCLQCCLIKIYKNNSPVAMAIVTTFEGLMNYGMACLEGLMSEYIGAKWGYQSTVLWCAVVLINLIIIYFLLNKYNNGIKP